jgi:transposase
MLWSADGTWEYLLQQIQAAADADGEVAWRSTPLPCAPISTPPAPVSRRPHRFQKGDAGSELTGEAARLRPPARRRRRRARPLTRRVHRQDRAINKLKQFRAVATRYDKRRYIYLGTTTAAALVIWLRS